jgi:5S rRNA maturation endonuclease (ribonuclease M5)
MSVPTCTPWRDFNDASLATAQPNYDLEDVREGLRRNAEAVLRHLFPQGKKEGHRFLVGNIYGAPGKSLVIELEGARRGLWTDFTTGEGGDLIDLWAAVRGLSVSQAFPQLVEDIAAWLALPPVTQVAAPSPKHAIDTLGRQTAKWDYLSAEGKLLACVYRYDPPTGKEYRPWNAVSRTCTMPDPRPLYHLPEVFDAEMIVLVEGEKCADALQTLGFAATTAMGGASAPVDKTDWSPLTDKNVIVWPDHDEAGRRYADTLTPKLQAIGVRSLRRVIVPAGKSAKWDAADAVAEGFDIPGLITAAIPVARPPSRQLADWRAIDRFVGEPKLRQWLVEGVFPLAQPSLIAASGGVGKSFLLLSLAREIAAHDGIWLNAPAMFGGSLAAQGIAVYLTAEDDAIEIHNRLRALGPIPDRLYVVPLPDAGGAIPLFAPDPMTKAAAITPAWLDLERQFGTMTNVKLVVFDPLQPLCALDLNVPENAQFVCSRLAALAASTGASVIVSHHFAKREAWTPEQAREAIRGTGGLVDGMRSVYALWLARNDDANTVLKTLRLPQKRGSIVYGGVVKANGRANLKIVTFVRDERGLLCDRTAELLRTKTTAEDLLPELKRAIAAASAVGKPYTKTGINGVHERRFELPISFHTIGKHSMVAMIETLLASEAIVQSMADNSKSVKWLDVPDGETARGDTNFAVGYVKRQTDQYPQPGGVSNDI